VHLISVVLSCSLRRVISYEVQRIREEVQVCRQLLWKFVMFILDIMWNKQVLLQHDVS